MARLKVAVLISGRGSNMGALLDDCARPDHPAEIVLVISNMTDAAGLQRAQAAGIATQVIVHRDYADRESFEKALDASLRAGGTELICLAGFMRLLTEWFVERWYDRLINIHPSLLPAFRGLDTHERALAAGVRFAGCTVHFVRPAMDAGPIITQAAVPILPGDDPERLAARVLATEHEIYPLAVRLFAEDRLKVEDERVLIDGAQAPAGTLINPLAEI